MATAATSPERQSFIGKLSTLFYLHPRLTLAALLGPPLAWLGVVYLGSLFMLVAQSFFHLDSFSGKVVREFTLATYGDLLSQFENYNIVVRTAGMAAAVTLAAALLAFPIAYYMARYASPRLKALLYLAVLIPLWSNYLVRVYAWKIILAKEGILGWFLTVLHLDFALDALLKLPVIGGPSLSNSLIGMFLVFLYVWLPYMILPIQAALERVPKSLLEASGDLGAKPGETFRHVILPLIFPGVVAGSIFTFSLTLGDFIIPTAFGTSQFFIGMAVYVYQGTSGNVPLAAAFTIVPILIMAIYLSFAKRLGAFDAL
ncbi:MAG: ABC transporter permease [Chloroflexi bacterium]|nr:ABC transporter permease [Chloroflexota bacterium]